jgi:putative tryptophan/tyrosine transport system substrate-binding protein
LTRKGFQAGLREIGYREGRDIVVDYRYADGKVERLADLVATAIGACGRKARRLPSA